MATRRAPGFAPGVNKLLLKPATQPLLFALALLPLAWLVWGMSGDP